MVAKPQKESIHVDQSNITRREDAFNVYINNTLFAYTKWDFQMICGRVSASRDKRFDYPEELGVITMSPGHAKAILEALRINIATYEAEFGEITLPKEDNADVLASAVKTKKP